MRYILDGLGYIEEVTFGGLIQCNDKSCTEYNGAIPEGYETLEDWQCNANIRAYKIVDSNLVYDEKKDNELQEQFELDAEENAPASHGWVRNQLGKSNQFIIDEFSNNIVGTSLVVLNDTGEYEIPKIKITSDTIENCNVVVTNKNLLGNDMVSQTINGVTITVNSDSSITLNGTATTDIEVDLKGISNNLDILFLIQKDIDYVVSGFTPNVALNLYHYDGTNRTLIATSTNGIINLSETQKVTHATLSIANGESFEETTISPQIEINSVATEFIEHQENKTSATLDNGVTEIDTLFSYLGTTIIMLDQEAEIEVDYFKYKSLEEKFAEIEVNEEEILIKVSANTTTINNNYQELISNMGELITSDQLDTLQNTIQAQMDANKLEISNIQTTITDGVSKVKTTSGTFDENGLTMEQSDARTKTILDETGVDVKDTQGNGEDILFAGYVDEEKAKSNEKLKNYEGQSVAYSNNMIVDNYFVIGTHSRIEDYEDGTGVFFIGGE